MVGLTVILAADHRGFPLKKLVAERLAKAGHTVVDLGTNNEERCDAGDFAVKLAADLRAHPDRMGVLICGTGQAMAITANRYAHIRAALCTDTTMARLTREHNDANVLVLGAHVTGQETALDCVDVFFATAFAGGRYAARRDKLTALGGL